MMATRERIESESRNETDLPFLPDRRSCLQTAVDPLHLLETGRQDLRIRLATVFADPRAMGRRGKSGRFAFVANGSVPTKCD